MKGVIMRCVTPKDQELINEIGHELKKRGQLTWSKLASKTGWSATTVSKYFDKNWSPGKYFQKPLKIQPIDIELAHSGLYLIAFQSIVDGKIVNLVKVGQSKNLKNRLASYQGMNPFVKCVDTKYVPQDELDAEEHFYHMLLGTKNTRYGNTEWFICDDEQYNYWTHRKL
jgi:hypothetical protein